VRERVISVGVLAPSFELADASPEAKGLVRLANHTDKHFAGTLKIRAPDGFAVTPAERQIRLDVGQTCEVAVNASVVRKGARAEVPYNVTLIRADGTPEWEGESTIDYLGPISRVVFKAEEDTWIIKKSPEKNYGKHAILNIDGGNAQAGDGDHAIAYVSLRPSVPGKPIRSLLRLYNAGNPTGDSGEIRLQVEPWTEGGVTYSNHPKSGRVLAKIGPVTERQVVELPLSLTSEELATDGKPLSFAIVPTSNDGVNYGTRESGQPAELIVEYEPSIVRP